MQICTSLQTNNHASTPPLSFLQAGCPSCRPTNSVKALKACDMIMHRTFVFALMILSLLPLLLLLQQLLLLLSLPGILEYSYPVYSYSYPIFFCSFYWYCNLDETYQPTTCCIAEPFARWGSDILFHTSWAWAAAACKIWPFDQTVCQLMAYCCLHIEWHIMCWQMTPGLSCDRLWCHCWSINELSLKRAVQWYMKKEWV